MKKLFTLTVAMMVGMFAFAGVNDYDACIQRMLKASESNYAKINANYLKGTDVAFIKITDGNRTSIERNGKTFYFDTKYIGEELNAGKPTVIAFRYDVSSSEDSVTVIVKAIEKYFDKESSNRVVVFDRQIYDQLNKHCMIQMFDSEVVKNIIYPCEKPSKVQGNDDEKIIMKVDPNAQPSDY